MTQDATKRQPALIPSDLKQADYNRNRFLAHPPEGTTLEDVLNPAFWAHVSRQFVPGGGDIIEVVPADRSFYAELLVVECRKVGLVTNIRLVKLNYVPLVENKPAGKAAKSEYEVVYRGEARKHTVTRTADKEVVSEGHATKQDALNWIDEQELNKLTQG